jgi:hypothetical protein
MVGLTRKRLREFSRRAAAKSLSSSAAVLENQQREQDFGFNLG